MDEDVVGPDVADQVAIVERQILEPGIGGLDENLRLVASPLEHSLDAEHLVPDGISIPERRQHLMHARGISR